MLRLWNSLKKSKIIKIHCQVFLLCVVINCPGCVLSCLEKKLWSNFVIAGPAEWVGPRDPYPTHSPHPPTKFLCEKIKKSSRTSLHALRFLTRLRFLRKVWSKKMYSFFFRSCIDVHNDQVIMQPLSRRRYSKGKKSFSSAHRSKNPTQSLLQCSACWEAGRER